jgi:hypothetical protein
MSLLTRRGRAVSGDDTKYADFLRLPLYGQELAFPAPKNCNRMNRILQD